MSGKGSDVFDSFVFNMEQIKLLAFSKDNEMSKPEKKYNFGPIAASIWIKGKAIEGE